jgi:hypothetical protein
VNYEDAFGSQRKAKTQSTSQSQASKPKKKGIAEMNCDELFQEMLDVGSRIIRELQKYDPVVDKQGGSPNPKKGPSCVTVPYGHYTEIKNLQRRLRKVLDHFESDKCKDHPGRKSSNVPVSRKVANNSPQKLAYEIPRPIYEEGVKDMTPILLFPLGRVASAVGNGLKAIGEGLNEARRFLPRLIPGFAR